MRWWRRFGRIPLGVRCTPWYLGWLDGWLRRSDRPPARGEWHLVPDFRAALDRVQVGAGTVLVTGSFHTVGDVMAAVGMGPA